MPPPVVEATALCRIYDGPADSHGGGRLPGSLHAVAGVDLSVGPGELVVLTGPSGCGKTTLLNLLGLVDRPTSGEVVIEGRATSGLDDDGRTLIRRRRIGHVFQFFHVLPHLTLEANVELPLLLDGVQTTEGGARARAELERVGLGGRAGDFPHRLSGGELQRVAIARALVKDPALVLADEPTGNLDSATGRGILDVLAGLVAEGRLAVVMATHSAQAAAYGTRRLAMRDGRLSARGEV